MKITQRIQSGFTLVEVTLALGIAVFSLVPIFALLPLGLSSNQSSIEQTAATGLTTTILDDLRAVPAASGTSTSVKFGFTIPSVGAPASTAPATIYLGQDGSPTAQPIGAAPVAGQSHYRVSIAFTPPAKGNSSITPRTATMVRILITWPAMADIDPTKWPTNFSGSYETVTALDRN